MFDKTEQDTPRTWRALLDQDVWWRTAAGGWVLIADMEPGHRANTVRWLLRRAERIAWQLGFAELGLMQGAPEDVVSDWLAEDERRLNDPARWLSQTPLVRALSAGLRS